jgi:cell division protein FtsI (penicillin-binding protein 3)
VVVVTLNGTHGIAGFGGQAAAPVFRTIAQEALRVMEVPRDLPDQPLPVARKKPELDDLSIADVGSDQPNILEEDADEGAGGLIAGSVVIGPRVPNFRGLTMRAVLAEAASKGMTVVANGSGVAREQDPAPGTPLREGERIKVQFAR